MDTEPTPIATPINNSSKMLSMINKAGKGTRPMMVSFLLAGFITRF
ncbi:hypothetical protein AB8E32_18670 [Marinomonas polaris]